MTYNVSSRTLNLTQVQGYRSYRVDKNDVTDGQTDITDPITHHKNNM